MGAFCHKFASGQRHAATGKPAPAPCAETKPGLRKDVRATSALIVILIAQMFGGALAQGQSSNMIGRWNVEINFADGNKRSLRFDVQADGKGTFLLLDPMLSRWGPAKPSEAKWTPGDQNSVTFSGAVEFPLGNVGRDAGTLMFKGNSKRRTRSAARWNSLHLSGTGPRNTARLRPPAIILPAKQPENFWTGDLLSFCVFRRHIISRAPHKMVTVLLPFLPKTSDPRMIVKRRARGWIAVPSASQSSALHVGAHESEDFIRAIRGSEKISRKSLKKY